MRPICALVRVVASRVRAICLRAGRVARVGCCPACLARALKRAVRVGAQPMRLVTRRHACCTLVHVHTLEPAPHPPRVAFALEAPRKVLTLGLGTARSALTLVLVLAREPIALEPGFARAVERPLQISARRVCSAR
eukprot:828502-Rhodomonas_salina.1